MRQRHLTRSPHKVWSKRCDQRSSAPIAARNALANDESGLHRFDRLITQEFDAYVSARRDFYRSESRWDGAPFWRRRHQRITLDPQSFVCLSRDPAAWRRAGAYLSVDDLTRLSHLCDGRLPAYAVVSTFRAARPGLPDERVILALQEISTVEPRNA